MPQFTSANVPIGGLVSISNIHPSKPQLQWLRPEFCCKFAGSWCVERVWVKADTPADPHFFAISCISILKWRLTIVGHTEISIPSDCLFFSSVLLVFGCIWHAHIFVNFKPHVVYFGHIPSVYLWKLLGLHWQTYLALAYINVPWRNHLARNWLMSTTTHEYP